MDALGSYIVGEIIKALGEGNLVRGGAFVGVFLVLWLELRGLKKQFKLLNETISKSFAAGEKRFETIEKDLHQIRLDVDQFRMQGGLHGKTV